MLFFLAISFEIGFFQQPEMLKWLINYDDTLYEAEQQNKPILLFFHGSDWCPPCIKMQKEVFDNRGFIDYAAAKVIFLNVDFPYKNKLSDEQLEHNNKLKKKFGLPDEFSQGYPQIVIINKNEKVLYQEKGYNGEGPEKLTGIIRKIILEM